MRLFWARPATLALLLLVSARFSGAQRCASFFSSLDGNLIDYGEFLTYEHPSSTSELAPVDTQLLVFQWTENVFADPVISPADSDEEYLEGIVNVTSMEINTISSLEGLPDYSSDWTGSIKTDIQLQYLFPVTDDTLNFTACTLILDFPLQDMNTATPTTDYPTYSCSLREDFPLALTIPYLDVIVQDLDGTSPNNLLKASFDEGCPLATDQPDYDGRGKNVTMTFMLTKKLDYDSMTDPVLTCQVNITDGGTDPGPLSTVVTVNITVEGFEDEPPVFHSPIYTSTLDSQQASAEPLSIQPSAINATDKDKDGSAISYSMVAYENDGPQWNDYFAIDASTAAVTLAQDIPDAQLGNYSIHFIVTAADGNNNEDTTILEIVLPTAIITSTTSASTTTLTTTPTTTPSTTSTTTTPATTPTTTPCTTPTTFTPTTDTCAPCPTTPITDTSAPCPTTPTTDTCAPCPTTQTPDTCTPCPTTPITDTSAPCPTTPTTDTCAPCPTASTVTLTTDAATTPSTTTPTTTTSKSTSTSAETVPNETCPPCATVVNTCPTLPTTGSTSDSSSTAPTTTPSPGVNTTDEIVASSPESGQTEPTCQTCDPCECTSPSTLQPGISIMKPSLLLQKSATILLFQSLFYSTSS